MCSKHIILIISWVFSTHGGSFFKNILTYAQEREGLKIIADQFGAPTSARFLADSTTVIAQELLGGQTDKFGTYHLASAGVTNWYGYACKVIEAANVLGISNKGSSDFISPIPTSAYPLPAPLPKNFRLSTAKIQKAFSLKIPEWEREVEAVLKQITYSTLK